MLYFQPRILAVAALGFASGLPLVLTASTLGVWLSEAGVSKTAIGLFSAVGTPYAFKFLWAPLIDHLPLPLLTRLLGRRRSWLLAVQVLLMGALVALGASHPEHNPWATARWAFVVAALSATQDTVIDAFRIELLEDNQQAAGAAAVVFGYRVGMLMAGAGALVISTQVGWQGTYAIMAVCIGAGACVAFFTKPEKSFVPEAPLRWLPWLKEAVYQPIGEFIHRQSVWLWILVFIVFFKLGDAMAGVMTGPFLLETGFSKTEIAAIVKSYGLLATLGGAFLGGALVNKWGMVQGVWAALFLQMASNALFVWQAHAGHDSAVLLAVISGENFFSGFGTTVLVAYISLLCHIRHTATQYALFSALASLGRIWLSTPSGAIVDQIGWIQFFWTTLLASIPGLTVFFFLSRKAARGRN